MSQTSVPTSANVHNQSSSTQDFCISMHFSAVTERLDAIQSRLELCQCVEVTPSNSSMYTFNVFNMKIISLKFTCIQIRRLAPCLFSKMFLFVHNSRCWNYKVVLIFLRRHYVLLMLSLSFLLCLCWSVCHYQCQLFFHSLGGRGMVWMKKCKHLKYMLWLFYSFVTVKNKSWCESDI